MPPPVEVIGILNAVLPDGRGVNISHPPIPEIGWPDMTMDLALSDRARTEDIAVGGAVRFTLELGPNGIYRIGVIESSDQTPEDIPPAASGAMDHGHHMHNMVLDAEGMVMNANADRLPVDCAAIGEEIALTVRVGTAHARAGTTFGYDRNVFRVAPCARVTVTLINEDRVRHQWMVHGLPRYIYPQGMFHLSAAGGAQKTGTFILPSSDATYLVHCDMPQHMEKGLKGQLTVGAGAGDLPSIPGITAARIANSYATGADWRSRGLIALAGLLGAIVVLAGLTRVL